MLRLLAGELKPQRGSARRPKSVARCSQEPALDAAIRDFAWGWSDGAWALQARLGLDPADLERWDQLSPGERRRWQIAAAVAAAPDGLLLDEPTDHLDAEARAWLLTALQGYRGAALVAAHDRALLDALVHTTLRLDRGRVVVTAGGASAALAQAEEDQRAALAALEEAAEQVRSARAKLANARRDRSAAEDQGRTSARLKGPRDSDARSLGAKNRVSWADRAHGRRVEVERRALDRAAEAHAALPRPDEFGGTLQIASAPGARGRLVAWRGDLRVGSRCLARGLEVVVERGARLQIAGRTGSGKSTLLQVLQAVSTLPPARVLVLPQELSPTRAAEDLRRLRALPTDQRGRVLQVVAALGVPPARLLASPALSPGEARKLALALGLGEGVGWLVLDEPTDHLDLPAIATLARALQRFEGAITYVTHDPAFAAEVGGAVLTLGA